MSRSVGQTIVANSKRVTFALSASVMSDGSPHGSFVSKIGQRTAVLVAIWSIYSTILPIIYGQMGEIYARNGKERQYFTGTGKFWILDCRLTDKGGRPACWIRLDGRGGRGGQHVGASFRFLSKSMSMNPEHEMRLELGGGRIEW